MLSRFLDFKRHHPSSALTLYTIPLGVVAVVVSLTISGAKALSLVGTWTGLGAWPDWDLLLNHLPSATASQPDWPTLISCFDDDNDQYHPPKLSEFGAHLVELLNSSDKNIQEMRQKNENMFVGLCCISSNTDPVIDCSFIDQRLV